MGVCEIDKSDNYYKFFRYKEFDTKKMHIQAVISIRICISISSYLRQELPCHKSSLQEIEKQFKCFIMAINPVYCKSVPASHKPFCCHLSACMHQLRSKLFIFCRQAVFSGTDDQSSWKSLQQCFISIKG